MRLAKFIELIGLVIVTLAFVLGVLLGGSEAIELGLLLFGAMVFTVGWILERKQGGDK